MFEQVDGKAGRKETFCNLEGSKGFIRMVGWGGLFKELGGELDCL